MEKNSNKSALGLHLLFGAWYLIGGIITTFLGGTLVMKLQGGLTPEALGSLMAIAGLPWVIKPLWGLVIDRFKSVYWWAMVASTAVAFSVLGLAAVDTKTSYWLVVALVLLPNVLRSLQDVAVDALAISASREENRGAIQMWMRVGTIIGSLLGGAGAMWLSKKIPWKEVCVLLVGISVLISVVLPTFLASNQVRESTSTTKASWKDFTVMIKSPVIYLGLLLAAVSLSAQQISSPAFYTWWSSGPYDKDMVMLIFLWAPAFQIAGAVLGGVLVKFGGKIWATVFSVILVSVSYQLIGYRQDWDQEAVMALSWATGLADTVYAVALFALLMDLADKKFTAMSFALLMAGTNVCGVWGPWLGGQMMASNWGVSMVFVFAGGLQLVVLPILFFIALARRKAVN